MRQAHGERGSITVFFCFFVLVIVGAISYSLYVGQQVERRINLQNTSDAAVVAMANHSANGLNMIAANNLSIGAAIHISGSVAILASYLSVVRALTYGIKDVLSDVASFVVGGGTKIQTDIWDRLAIVPSLYMKTAAGLTAFNGFLRDYWLLPAPLRSLETTRLNIPGSLAIPMQKSTLVPALTNYAAIKQLSPHDTVCHTIKSSEAVPEDKRDSFIRWMQGPLLTLGDNPLINGLNGILDKLALLHETVSKVSGIKIGFMNCGYGLKTKLFGSMSQLAGFITEGNSFMTGATGIATLNDAFNSVNLERKDFYDPPCITVLGVTVCTPPVTVCQAAYTTERGVKQAWINAEAMLVADIDKKIALAKTLQGVHDKKGLLSCQPRDANGKQVGGLVKGAIPLKDATGVTSCMDINRIPWYCPLKDEIKLPIPMCGGGEKHNGRIDDACKDYETFKNSEPGIAIADWGEQAKNYAESSGGSTPSEARKSSLGFLVPDPEHLTDFSDSITFVNAVTNPLRTAADVKPGSACEAGFKAGFEGKDFCENSPVMGFTNLFEKASREAMQGRQAGDVNLATGGLNALITQKAQDAAQAVSANDGALQGTFSRMQWVVSQSESYYRVGPKDPAPKASMQLFWPAWKSRLRPVSLLKDMLAFVAGTSPAKAGMANAAQLEMDN